MTQSLEFTTTATGGTKQKQCYGADQPRYIQNHYIPETFSFVVTEPCQF